MQKIIAAYNYAVYDDDEEPISDRMAGSEKFITHLGLELSNQQMGKLFEALTDTYKYVQIPDAIANDPTFLEKFADFLIKISITLMSQSADLCKQKNTFQKMILESKTQQSLSQTSIVD